MDIDNDLCYTNSVMDMDNDLCYTTSVMDIDNDLCYTNSVMDIDNDLCYTNSVMDIYPIYIMSSERLSIHYFPKNTSTLTEFLWNLQIHPKVGEEIS